MEIEKECNELQWPGGGDSGMLAVHKGGVDRPDREAAWKTHGRSLKTSNPACPRPVGPMANWTGSRKRWRPRNQIIRRLPRS